MDGLFVYRLAYLRNCIGHGTDGVCALPRLACVGRNALYGELKPGSALMGHLDLGIGRLGVEDPFAPSNPAGFDGGFNTAHFVFLVYGADEGQAALGQNSGLGNSLQLGGKGDHGACEAALHVAGASPIELVIAYEGAKGLDTFVPAASEHHGIHVTNEDQARLIARAWNACHELRSSGESFKLGDGNLFGEVCG